MHPHRPHAPARGASLLVLVAACALLALPAGASARAQETIFDAPRELIGGATPESRAAALDELRALGADTIRVNLPWRFLVPRPGRSQKPAGFNASNPRDYPQIRWGAVDGVVRGVLERGMRVLMTPAGPIPNWASKSGRSRIASPSAEEYGAFVTAVGRRYSGSFRPYPCAGGLPLVGAPACEPPLPRIGDWAVYNEPNQDIFLKPQRRRGKAVSPRIYRQLFLAAQAGLHKSGHGKDRLLIGETAPSGGLTGVDPVEFLRGVFCLRPNFTRRGGCEPIKATGWAHHPYTPGLAPFRRSPNPGLINLMTMKRLHRALRMAARTGATTKRLPVFITEFGIQSVPDREFGVSLKRQAEYLGIAEFLSARDPRIRAYGQYLLRDDPIAQEIAFTTGLRLEDGKKKPAYRAFALALAVKRLRGGRVLVWGHVRPRGSRRVRVSIRVDRRGSQPRRVRRVRTDKSGYFSFKMRAPQGRGLRWQASTTLRGGRKLTGAYVRSYRF